MTATPSPNPAILKAIESLNYRATVGDVAAQAGLNVNLAEKGLLTLASQADGELQVAETGDIVYQFPRNFRAVLREKDARIRRKETLDKIWRVLFYLIRMSFGVVLILLIVASVLAIIALTVAANSGRDDDNGGNISMPTVWFTPDFFWIFSPNYDRRRPAQQKSELNFLESIYSFLFGDGNPNADLEDRRWQSIGAVIRQHRGAVIAEQIAPFLDSIGSVSDQESEQFMLPVLTRFDGRPEVTPDGQFVYHFPSLQTTVSQQERQWLPAFLRESLYQFSKASSGQITLAATLGVVLLVLALVLTAMTVGAGAGILKAIAFVSLGYSAAYLLIPTIRNFTIKRRNAKILERNQERELRAKQLANPTVQPKLAYAEQFAAETVIQQSDLVYSTDRDLTEQEIERSTQIDAEWQRRLDGDVDSSNRHPNRSNLTDAEWQRRLEGRE
ncbi:hypothetical protein [Leptolyngbya sp. NIES-2104]|uniref:hypothetical protein n=1 Tax=Leptolyngbya sp. NIES-2104 TaxID=1552121 RepID=UPI0006EC5C93|nr:hypothetical protein [Leptolyngbya sp. NIES-2104]GAP93724.1 hypothetical protein NIES2104_02310 [Leptolyngbya sp. NIES-2104]